MCWEPEWQSCNLRGRQSWGWQSRQGMGHWACSDLAINPLCFSAFQLHACLADHPQHINQTKPKQLIPTLQESWWQGHVLVNTRWEPWPDETHRCHPGRGRRCGKTDHMGTRIRSLIAFWMPGYAWTAEAWRAVGKRVGSETRRAAGCLSWRPSVKGIKSVLCWAGKKQASKSPSPASKTAVHSSSDGKKPCETQV